MMVIACFGLEIWDLCMLKEIWSRTKGNQCLGGNNSNNSRWN